MNAKRVAVVFEGDIRNRMGVFNAVLNRVRHLRRVADYGIDVHLLQVYDGALMRCLRGSQPLEERPDNIQVEGETISLHWLKRSWADALGHRLLGKRPAHLLHKLDQIAAGLGGYSLISAHDRMGGYVARQAAMSHNIPHTITWHGASIHTDPFTDPMLKAATIELLHHASQNFFVSRGLLNKALELTTTFPACVLFNGAPATFKQLPDHERHTLRQELGAGNSKVVAFVGRFEPVKNVTLLPEIFSLIARKFGQPVTFWTVGDGSEHEQVRQALDAVGLNVRMWGMQPQEMMPRLMNSIDVLVLPSQREGLPLVTVEALQCGANVVGSDVMGTAECIGHENAFEINDKFIERLTDRAVQMLNGHVQQPLPHDISWEVTADKENEIYQKLMHP